VAARAVLAVTIFILRDFPVGLEVITVAVVAARVDRMVQVQMG
jgi:hypothetical protein